MESLLAPLVNVVILLGLLVYYLRKPLAAFVSDRHTSVRDELQRVADRLRHAQSQYDEFSAKLKAMQAEIGQLRDQARLDGEAVKLRIVNDGRRVSTAVVEHAKTAADSVLEDLRAEIMKELSSRVLTRSEEILKERLTAQDRVRLRSEFGKDLERGAS